MYIGQTNDFKRRMREHKNKMYGICEKVLYKAIEKYGWDNFSMEIIEDYCEDYQEKEQYWIEKLNTRKNGYNVDTIIASSEHIYIDEIMFNNIIQDLTNNTLSYQDIADKYNILNDQTIRDINRGFTHKHENINYPIRPTRNELSHQQALAIINDLKNTDLKMSEIAKNHNCSITFISNINTGDRCRIDEENYPIRSNTRKGQKFTEETIDNIYEDILNTNQTWSELSKKYNCNTKVFQHINQGYLHRKENYNYPLRQNSKGRNLEKALQIIHLLKTTDWPYTKIAKELNTNTTSIRNINNGKVHYQENEHYPIRNK